MPKSIFIIAALFLISTSLLYASNTADRDFYQIKVYHLKTEAQEKLVEDFLKTAYLPALHRAGIAKVGVFKPVQAENKNSGSGQLEEKLIYVFIPFKSSAQFLKLEKLLEKDVKYQIDGKGYLDAAYNAAPYERIESILLSAFDDQLKFNLPTLSSAKKDRIYELRSYEGHTEKIYKNKVEMFNKGGEVKLFKRLGFNAVFYGEVISGSRMPNLMYMTTFENKADRDEHWKAFSKDEQWEKLKTMPEYQNNVSKNDTRFLYPTDYSDI